MLDTLFLQILNMSFTASYVILFVLLARLLLKKAPKIFSYALWSVVLFRLVCPFSFESAISLLPYKTGITPEAVLYTQTPGVDVGIPAVSAAINAALPVPNLGDSVNPMQIVVAIAAVIWLVGIAALLIYSVVSLLNLRRRLKDAVQESENIYTSPSLTSPFVMGLFSPKIYLPASLTERERDYILLHEQTHIGRLDHVVKLLSFFVLCVHWFNPLVWVAFFLCGRDMELSCDEAVIKKLGSEVKKDYSTSLLTLATGRRIVGGTPLAFGEGDTKSRIKNVLHYKKPAFWVVAVALVAVVAIGIGLAANQKPSRHFAMTGTQLSDLQPENITGHIAEITKVDAGALELTNDDFGLLVSSDFSWVRNEAIRFVFSNQRNVPQTAQLRLFPEDPDFFVTEPADWVPSEGEHFKLQLYLEALKYLPQEAIAALCEKEPQRYAIALAAGDRANDPARCIYYDKNGVTEAGGWWVQLDISPLYWDEGGGFHGVGSDVIHLYYGDVAANPKGKPAELDAAQTLWDARTEYVGNNAAVGQLLGLLEFPDSLTYQFFALQTDGDERGVELHFMQDTNRPLTDLETWQLDKNALLLFALIGNLEDVRYSIEDRNGGSVVLHQTRAWADKAVKGDIRDYGESAEKLQELLQLAAVAAPTEYTITKHDQNGAALAESTAENQALAQKVVMDGLVKSAAWEGVDVGTLEKYYLIRKNFPETGEVQDYYAYRLADGTAAIQFGAEGRYSILSDELFEALEKDVSFPDTAPDV